jgi:hypothetical protein
MADAYRAPGRYLFFMLSFPGMKWYDALSFGRLALRMHMKKSVKGTPPLQGSLLNWSLKASCCRSSKFEALSK